jgi:hypothetical protein
MMFGGGLRGACARVAARPAPLFLSWHTTVALGGL